MFGLKAYRPPEDCPVTRREFFSTAAKFFCAIPFVGFFNGSVFGSQSDFYEKAWQRRDCSADPVTVYKMVPLPHRRYDKAEARHMANKIFPSLGAARAHRPHRGFLYGLKPVPLPPVLVNGMDVDTLFCGRKDFDQRVRTDQHHWHSLGVDIDGVFDLVRNA